MGGMCCSNLEVNKLNIQTNIVPIPTDETTLDETKIIKI